MRLPKRDLIATVFVGVAVLVYLLWAGDAALPGLGSARMTGLAILALGFAASASAVVPTFDALLHGNKIYLVAASLLGVTALVGGLLTLISASVWGLGVMVAATVTLWLTSTVHHSLLSRGLVLPGVLPQAAETPNCPNCGHNAHEVYCEVCGYEIIEQARAKALPFRRI